MQNRRASRQQYRARKKKAMIQRAAALAALAAVVALIVLLARGCGRKDAVVQPTPAPTPDIQAGLTEKAPQAEGTPEPTPEPAPTPQPTPWSPRSATILSMGDVVMHNAIREAARDKDTDTYDFTSMFSYIEPIIQAADYAVINVDGVIIGPFKGEYRSFPQFNLPVEMIQNLLDVGVDMVTTANNHILDFYWDGLRKYLDLLERYGMAQVGCARTREERKTPVIQEINGIQVGFLSYTTMTNAMEKHSAADATEYGVAYTSGADYAGDVRALRSAGADFVVVYMHWGEEYQRFANKYQIAIAREVAAAGADIIIGGHPHVVQPIKNVQADMADGSRNSILCAFSMGNILSNQPEQYRDTGYMFRFTIDEVEEGVFRVASPEYIPTYYWTEGTELRSDFDIHIINCGEYLNSPPAGMSQAKHKRLRQCWQEALEIVGTDYAQPAEK